MVPEAVAGLVADEAAAEEGGEQAVGGGGRQPGLAGEVAEAEALAGCEPFEEGDGAVERLHVR